MTITTATDTNTPIESVTPTTIAMLPTWALEVAALSTRLSVATILSIIIFAGLSVSYGLDLVNAIQAPASSQEQSL